MMMAHTPVNFSINMFDCDWDIVEEGVFLHFGVAAIKIGNDLRDYESFINELEAMKNAVAEVYASQ